MGSFFVCKSCGNNIYLYEQKEELFFPHPIRCNMCGNTNAYLEYEIQQERYDLTCPICNGRFFIRRMPPTTVRCPHSNSLLHVSSDASISVLQAGIQPITSRGGTVAEKVQSTY
jgi:DNA-directed RNA polymerase subunit RPC12/RpoP